MAIAQADQEEVKTLEEPASQAINVDQIEAELEELERQEKAAIGETKVDLAKTEEEDKKVYRVFKKGDVVW